MPRYDHMTDRQPNLHSRLPCRSEKPEQLATHFFGKPATVILTPSSAASATSTMSRASRAAIHPATARAQLLVGTAGKPACRAPAILAAHAKAMLFILLPEAA
jgi:hypothetical protein